MENYPKPTIVNTIYNGFLIEKANCMKEVDSAIIMAKVTGSIGCKHQTQKVGLDYSKQIETYAFVKRINNG